jgi:SAM-dependent methyltransferase
MTEPHEHSGGTVGSGVMHPQGLHRLLHPVWFAPVHSATARALELQPNERVLDVGAGEGTLSVRLADLGAKVVCLEPDQASLDVARSRLAARDVEFYQAHAEHIPLEDASIDVAVASVTAHHWSDQESAFAELARVIKPGGRLVMVEFKPAGPALRRLRRLAGSKHTDAPTAEEWSQRLRAAGFRDAQAVQAGLASHLALFVRAVR